jgi:predicted ATPase/DNA-binding SARP family transcriptional activator
MHFRVLGSLEVGRGNDLVDIGSSNERKILTALLVEANAVVSTSRLIDVVWGENPPASDRNALQTYIARLRRRLATEGAPGPIVTRPPGYAIELRSDQLDSLQFRELLDEARATAAADPHRTLALLDRALELWRGSAFAEFAGDDVARAAAARLEELRYAAMTERVEVLLTLGRSADAVSVLEGLVAAEPHNEQTHAQLMRALARGGRQVDALRLYQRFRERLADELGLEPSASLRELEGQILAHAPDVTPAEPVSTPPPIDGNLVPAITTFVGREHDVAGLVDLLTRARIVTLVGVGGVGKSRLAVRLAETVASAFPDGIWVVELARITTPDAVPHAVAAVLGTTSRAGDEVAAVLVDALRARRLLLIVDNCEHVLTAAAALIETLARRCPRITIVATSRERLGVAGEHVWPLLPLPVPAPAASGDEVAASPAVALFLDRVRAARADFQLAAANTDAVVEICRGLDGVPLALEIAAARLGVLSPNDLARRLRDRFALLTIGPRGEGERHRTLRALVDWSYELLDDAERRIFEQLSVFAGGWTLEAAGAVCAPGAVSASEVAAMVAGLADKSMVIPPAPSGPARYGMLETLRLYGAEHLDARGAADTTAEAHARYFVALSEQADVGLRGPHEREWVDRLRAELDNLRAAHVWCRMQPDPDLALRLSAALHRFACWQANDEILSWAEALADLPSTKGHPLLPVVQGSAANRRAHRGELDIARRYAELALPLCDGPDDVRRALAIEAIATVHLFGGRLEEALAHCGEAARLWRLAGDGPAAAWNYGTRAVCLGQRGDLDLALAVAEEARQIPGATDNHTMMAAILYSEGEALLEVDPVRALGPIEQALAHAEAAGNVLMKGIALVSRTSLRGRHGDPRVALELFDDVIRYWRRGGGWTTQWIALRNFIELLTRVGEYEAAAVLYGACAASTTSRPSFGAEADRLEAIVDTLVAHLGDTAFRDARVRGEELSDDEVVSFALSVTERLLG